MNFDDIKPMWDSDQSSDMKLPNKISQLKRAHGPLDQIRKNMRYEFYAQIVAVVLMGFLFPLHFNFRPELIAPFFALYAVMVAITVYFLVKYYLFYKALSNITLTSREHLYNLYFEIRLHMEIYKAFSYSLVPFVLIFIGMVALSSKKDMLLISTKEIYIMVAAFAVTMALIAIGTSAWVNVFYGKYAKRIKALLDELNENDHVSEKG